MAWTKKETPFVAVYTDTQTRQYEKALAWAAKAAYRGEPLLGPLKLTVTAFMEVPASWSKRKRDAALAGSIRPTAKPDPDNCAKSALDACNGIIYRDDSQVVDLRVIKTYDETPRLRVEVAPIEILDVG